MTKLEAIKARLAAATPGPWEHCGQTGHREIKATDGSTLFNPSPPRKCQCGMVWGPDGNAVVAVAMSYKDEDYTGGEGYTEEQKKENMALIAHAPADLALLLAVAEAAKRLTGSVGPVGEDYAALRSALAPLLEPAPAGEGVDRAG